MFNFDLPAHLIAQHPAEKRDASRLLVVHRGAGTIAHHHFAELPALLHRGDLLVLNDTRVLPARLLGRREQTGGKWEGLFLRRLDNGSWELLCQTRGHLRQGETILVESGPLRLRLENKLSPGSWLARPSDDSPVEVILQKYGHIPLPPYIRKGRDDDQDRERYQTIYAQHAGAVAAPTAGLHFSEELFAAFRQHGIGRSFVTLHVGWGTFQPLQNEDVTQHKMHSEWGELPEASVRGIAECRDRGGRVVAVGTTSVRVLESVAATGPLRRWSGDTDLFIRLPFEFRVVDALITNFHLPRTSLLLLVSAFAGDELLRHAYESAIAEQYRFFSYGDAMLIL